VTACEQQAETILRHPAETDPTTHAKITGGSRTHAEAFGFTWPTHPERCN
jgi:hypothetical protein